MTPGVVMALLAMTPQVCPPVALSQVSQISRVGIRKETTYTWSLAGMSQSFCFEPRLGTHRLQTQLQSFPHSENQVAEGKLHVPCRNPLASSCVRSATKILVINLRRSWSTMSALGPR